MTFVPSWYKSPLDLPQARSGKMQIRHRVIQSGKDVPVVGVRQAMLRGVNPVRAMLEQPLRVHELVEEDVGVWMTDLPEELNQIAEMLATVKPKGRVLVGGLGLGILAHAVSVRAGVTSVTVIERDPDVIKLCARSGYVVIEKDIRTYLESSAQPADYYLLDTWQGTNEGAWWENVLPLRRAIRRRWGRKPRIHCWAEDIMLGQIVRTLMTCEPHWYYRDLPLPMTKLTALKFVADVGLPSWEKRYGAAVDIALAPTGD